MKEGFFRSEIISPEEKNLHQFRGASIREVLEYLEGEEADIPVDTGEENWKQRQERKNQSIFEGFLRLLREKGLRVSTPEWLQFLQVLSKKATATELRKIVDSEELLNKVRLFAKTTLVKNKADEAAFHEAFDEYFELAAKIYNRELANEAEEEQTDEETKETRNSGTQPDIKEQLGIKEVKEDLEAPEEGEHEDNEQVHGGKKDQHNDILKKEDLSKQGGGSKKEGPKGEGDKGEPSEGKGDKGDKGQGEGEKGDKGHGKGDKGEEGQGKGDKGEAGQGQGDKGEAGAGKGEKGEPSGKGKGSAGEKAEGKGSDSAEAPTAPKNKQTELTETGFLVGGGKGKSVNPQKVVGEPIIHEGVKLDKEAIAERERTVGKVDRRMRYEVRPDRASMREVIRNIRRIILDVSETKSRSVDLRRTVGNFARRDFRFDYQREREKQPEIVLFIDVGGPVDEWSPLVKEVTEEMAEGLTKLEVYFFHNNLYGYAWKADPMDQRAKPQDKKPVDIKKIIKKRKKVIIYGDAEMSDSELYGEQWPKGDPKQYESLMMAGDKCLGFIKQKSDSVVWLSPVFRKEWQEHDSSGTIQEVGEIIPMHDLTVGGVEDAIKELMKK